MKILIARPRLIGHRRLFSLYRYIFILFIIQYNYGLNIEDAKFVTSTFVSNFVVNGTKSNHFTARRYVSAVYAVAMCPSVCPYVYVCHKPLLSKWQYIGSPEQRHIP